MSAVGERRCLQFFSTLNEPLDKEDPTKIFFLFQTLCLLVVTMAEKSVTVSRRLPVSKEKIINLNLTEMKEVKLLELQPLIQSGRFPCP